MATQNFAAFVVLMLLLVVSLALNLVAILTDYWFLVETKEIVSDTTIKQNTYNYGFWRKCYGNVPDSPHKDHYHQIEPMLSITPGRLEDWRTLNAVAMLLLGMKELGVKTGTARDESHTGCRRQLVNQYRTGTLSHATLMEMLRKGSDNLWMCPACNEDDLPLITHSDYLATEKDVDQKSAGLSQRSHNDTD